MNLLQRDRAALDLHRRVFFTLKLVFFSSRAILFIVFLFVCRSFQSRGAVRPVFGAWSPAFLGLEHVLFFVWATTFTRTFRARWC